MCPVKKEMAKSNAVAETQEKRPIANLSPVKAGSHHDQVHIIAVKMRNEISSIWKLAWDKELKSKPRGMSEMRVDTRDQIRIKRCTCTLIRK